MHIYLESSKYYKYREDILLCAFKSIFLQGYLIFQARPKLEHKEFQEDTSDRFSPFKDTQKYATKDPHE